TMDNGATLVRKMATCYSDVDVNGHVNSVKYIEHILDLFDVDFYRNHRLQRFEIAYVTEAHGGDTLSFYLQRKSDVEFCVKITKHVPDEVEVVRSLVRFVKE
ncbi:MAG: acyl-[acyl-carrier-protein] thioesterase, partial [Prevotella sp.]